MLLIGGITVALGMRCAICSNSRRRRQISGPRSRLRSLRRSSIHPGTTKATLIIILILLLILMLLLLMMMLLLLLLLLMLIIIAHSGEPRISVRPKLLHLRSRLRRGCLCSGLLRVRCSCHIMLRVIIRRRLLVVVVVIVRVRHLARIEGLLVPHILVTNAMHDGAAGGGAAVKSKTDGGGRMKVLYRKSLGINAMPSADRCRFFPSQQPSTNSYLLTRGKRKHRPLPLCSQPAYYRRQPHFIAFE